MALGDRGFLVHSGQHYDDSLSASFFATYGLPAPEVKLEGVGARVARRAVRRDHRSADRVLHRRPARLSLSCRATRTPRRLRRRPRHFLDIPVVHVEAGVRSYDRAMPEEINRQLIGVVAELHCAPTELAAEQLRREGIDPRSDPGHRQHRRRGDTRNAAVRDRPAGPPRAVRPDGGRVRPCDDPPSREHRRRRAPRRDLARVDRRGCAGAAPVAPAHPCRRGQASGSDGLLDRLRTVAPFDHPTFLGLARHDGCSSPTPAACRRSAPSSSARCIVLRNSTERPEAIEAGFARRVVPGPDLPSLLRDAIAERRLAAEFGGQELPVRRWHIQRAHRPRDQRIPAVIPLSEEGS